MNRVVLTFCFIFLSMGLYAQEVRDTIIITDNWLYEGQWPEGEGVRYSEKRGIYIGRFVESEPVGMCLCISPGKNEVYYGQLKEGRRHGYGILKRPGGFYYQGNFSEGYFEGVGKLYYPDKSIYLGYFHVGKPTFEHAQQYTFATWEEYNANLPQLPEYELTRRQRKFLKQALKSRKTDNCVSERVPVRVSPKFLGLDPSAFSKWVNSRLVFPVDALAKKQVGTVKIQFTILNTGELANPYVVDSSGIPSFDIEVLRVVCQSPEWIPGTKDGERVDVTYMFPVMFGFK
ncbi:MAG: TonB family protein [Bacteroidales bacterium]|nr:TonB family protein [Bacteroidales bacterium]